MWTLSGPRTASGSSPEASELREQQRDVEQEFHDPHYGNPELDAIAGDRYAGKGRRRESTVKGEVLRTRKMMIEDHVLQDTHDEHGNQETKEDLPMPLEMIDKVDALVASDLRENDRRKH